MTSTVTLNWVPRFNASGYKIYRSTAAIDLANLPSPIVSLASDAVTYDDVGVNEGTEYFYVLAAENTESPTQAAYSSVSLISAGTGGGGGAPPMPASVLHLATTAEFNFQGNDLVSISNARGDMKSRVVGAPQKGANNGYIMSDATSLANYVTCKVDEIAAAAPSGHHLAVCYRKTDQTDPGAIVFATTDAGEYLLACQSGSSSSVSQNATVTSFAVNALSLSASSTRGETYNAFYNSTDVITAFAENVSSVASPMMWLNYFAAGLASETEVLGFAVFTDFSERASVAAHLEYFVGLSQPAPDPAIPSSIIHLGTKQDFEFTSGALTNIEFSIGSAFLEIVGSPAEGPNGGIAVTESSSAHIRLNKGEISVAQPSGVHIAFTHKRNGTADTRTIVGGDDAFGGGQYFAAAQDGSSNPTDQNAFVTGFRVNGVDVSKNRNALWDAAFGNTNITTLLIQDVSEFSAPISPYFYDNSFSFNGELEILGVAFFTDWSQADAVAAYLDAQAAL